MRNHKKLLQFLRPDPAVAAVKMPSDDDEDDDRCTPLPSPMSSGSASTSAAASPSPYMPSPWVNLPGLGAGSALAGTGATGLLGSLVKADGHVYSMAAAGDLLYTGTDSKNVRVWKDQREFAGFKCGSGLVKAIVVAGDGRIYTGHQDGKVRVWRRDSTDDLAVHKRVGSLPRLGELLRSSVRPSHYVQTGRRKQTSLWLRHFDAVSCLSLDAEAGVIYSGSWDRTFKVWRVADSRCLESVRAHDDAINAVAADCGVVYSASADGRVKAWEKGKSAGSTHSLLAALVARDGVSWNAVAVSADGTSAGRRVYAAGSDGHVLGWDRHGGARWNLACDIKAHAMAVLCLCVAGDLVCTGSADKTIGLWRRQPDGGLAKVGAVGGHEGPVKCIQASVCRTSNGCMVYSGGLDKSIRVWWVPNGSNGDERRPETDTKDHKPCVFLR